MDKYIIYYRVSTKKQGESGLGLEAQEDYIENYFRKHKTDSYEILETVTDNTSAKGMLEDRPTFKKVVKLAEKEKATILVAKLDRLSRDMELIAHLKKRVDFKVAVMPYATKFELYIWGALAEQERDMIAERTQNALNKAKQRGVKLGGYRGKTRKRNEESQLAAFKKALEYKDILLTCRLDNKYTLQATADFMNKISCKTPQGGKFYANTVSRYIELLKNNDPDTMDAFGDRDES